MNNNEQEAYAKGFRDGVLGKENTPRIISGGQIQMDFGTREVLFKKDVVKVTNLEWRILECLVLEANKVVSRQELYRRAFDWADDAWYSNVIDVHMRNIRSKLPGVQILTISGIGYRLISK